MGVPWTLASWTHILMGGATFLKLMLLLSVLFFAQRVNKDPGKCHGPWPAGHISLWGGATFLKLMLLLSFLFFAQRVNKDPGKCHGPWPAGHISLWGVLLS